MGNSRKKGKSFRFKAKKMGLTYSCPVDVDINPLDSIWNDKTMVATMEKMFPDNTILKYVIGKEAHQSGKMHYHMFLELANPHETENARYWDILGVHPNLCKGTIGKGWQEYCAKHDDYITNYFEKCPYAKARDLCENGKADEAFRHLWAKRPRDMALHGECIEKNLKLKKKKGWNPVLYEGPYWPIDWDEKRHTLILNGDPGVGKTQWARWWGAQKGGYFYCKGSIESMKHYAGQNAIIFDDIDVTKCKDLTDVFDVENGGVYQSRYHDAEIPAGVPRVWLCNPGVVIPDPYNRIIGRRAVVRDF